MEQEEVEAVLSWSPVEYCQELHLIGVDKAGVHL